MRKVLMIKKLMLYHAMPNHWHALGTIWLPGRQARTGKPASRLLEAKNDGGGAQIQQACAGRSQNRSIANVMEAMKFLHDGGIGDVFMARGLCIKLRDSFGIA